MPNSPVARPPPPRPTPPSGPNTGAHSPNAPALSRMGNPSPRQVALRSPPRTAVTPPHPTMPRDDPVADGELENLALFSPPAAAASPSAARRRLPIRRSSSFKRVGSVPQMANETFTTDPTLHAEWATFLDAQAPMLADVQRPKEGGGGGAGATATAGSIEATRVHGKWAELIDGQVNRFLAVHKTTEDEFHEMLKIDRAEENRDGEHYYRWVEVIEFEPMMAALRATVDPSSAPAAAPAKAKISDAPAPAYVAAHPGVRALLQHVTTVSNAARSRRRRVVCIFPLLARWSAPAFSVVDKAVTAALSTEGVHAELTRVQQKELVRWRSRLTVKVLSSSGAYVEQRPDEAAWARFIGFATSQMGADSFDIFIAALEAKADDAVAADASSPEGTRRVTAARRLILQCFSALDECHQGRVSLTKVVRALEKSKVLAAGKPKAKFVARWSAKLAQVTASQKAAGGAADFSDAEDSDSEERPNTPGSSGPGSSVLVPLREAIELIFDAAAPGADASTGDAAAAAMPLLQKLFEHVS